MYDWIIGIAVLGWLSARVHRYYVRKQLHEIWKEMLVLFVVGFFVFNVAVTVRMTYASACADLQVWSMDHEHCRNPRYHDTTAKSTDSTSRCWTAARNHDRSTIDVCTQRLREIGFLRIVSGVSVVEAFMGLAESSMGAYVLFISLMIVIGSLIIAAGYAYTRAKTASCEPCEAPAPRTVTVKGLGEAETRAKARAISASTYSSGLPVAFKQKKLA